MTGPETGGGGLSWHCTARLKEVVPIRSPVRVSQSRVPFRVGGHLVSRFLVYCMYISNYCGQRNRYHFIVSVPFFFFLIATIFPSPFIPLNPPSPPAFRLKGCSHQEVDRALVASSSPFPAGLHSICNQLSSQRLFLALCSRPATCRVRVWQCPAAHLSSGATHLSSLFVFKDPFAAIHTS